MSEPANTFRAPLPEELAPLFPNYQILSLIATGGMGAVYHAVQTSLEREVAIKILPVEFGKDPGFCESFEAEAKAMARLNHPNLISVYDFGEVNGMLFIVMEHVPGLSLHAACDGSAIDPAEVIRLLTGISQGLAHAHEHGILHRDIKPANILLDSRMQPKIGDFGLARPLGAKVEVGEAIFGTPGYTAPEVLEPPHTMDQRADIFSLGVLLRELLTGRLPGSDPRPPSLISHCDPRFDAVVQRATHPDPRQRYQNAAEIADALQTISSSAGPRMMRTASPVAARRPAARVYSARPSKNGGGGLPVILLLLAGAAAVFIFRNRIFPKADPSPAPDPVVEHTPKPVMPDAVDPDPEPVKPESSPLVSEPEPVKPEPTQVVSEPEPVKLEPGPVVSEPGTMPGTSGSATTGQPKFDVKGFLTRARSVMAKRCGPEIARHDEALGKNLSDFRSHARKLIKPNLTQNFHEAAERELDAFLATRKADGNRLGEKLEPPLKFKKWLVELHEEYQSNEAKIDEDMVSALAEQQKTYLQGLAIRIKALQDNDPAAADLIKAENDKVTDSPDYFADLMREATRNQ